MLFQIMVYHAVFLTFVAAAGGYSLVFLWRAIFGVNIWISSPSQRL